MNFVASPPSMVAAGSMVAAVDGLQTRIVGDASVSQKMTERLAQTIGCDPVSISVHWLYSHSNRVALTDVGLVL